jgi:phage head maturation protease
MTWQQRDEDRRDIVTRGMQLRAATVNAEQRTVEATISTGDPVEVYDWRRGETIDEVLLPEGARIPSQMPMLANHSRSSLRDVLGSVRDLRVDGNSVAGRLHFAESEDADHAWQMVRGGHLTDVSVGYRVMQSTEIAAGQTATVLSKQYTAGKRVLRIATEWLLREGSLVPIGADNAAKIREDSHTFSRKEIHVNPRLRAYLETIGLRSEATEDEAQSFYEGLDAGQRAQADEAAAATRDAGADDDPPPSDATPPTAEQVAERAIAAERDRVRQIVEMAGADVSEVVRQRAVNEGWDTARAAREFLASVRQNRLPPTGPAIHLRSHDADCTRETLGAALMIRHGLDPVRQHARYVDGCYRPRREGQRDEALERAADLGWQWRDLSLVDFCREACRIDTGRIPASRGECIRAAVSGGTLSAIFTTNVSAALVAAYTEATDTTAGWCSDADVPNFQSNERAAMGKFQTLTRHRRGGTAEHLDQSDSYESYRIARYAGQFVVDEQDIIDDRFGAIEGSTPAEIGNAARALRPDLVYAILLANATLTATSGALFNATATTTSGGHANLHSGGAMSAAYVQAVIQMMAKQRIRTRPLNLRPRFLIVPQDLLFTAQIICASAFRYSSEGDLNPVSDLMLQIVADDRIGATGVTDPASGTAYTGTATNYFMAARPGENGAKTIEVGYLRGTGRAPQIRSFVLDKGQWGLGWDVNMDIGAKALDFRALVKSTGAA